MEQLQPQDLVQDFLRAQNLEHIRQVDDAIELYERAVSHGFDAVGPYDRLIHIYRAREQHTEVVRVADAALEHVRTYEDKRSWYRAMRAGAEEAMREAPRDRRGAEF